ncbi:MAG: nicotinate phosphoribosyltransferase [Acidobacteriota bacterium]
MASVALLTDLYQLTMAYGYWRSGKAGDEAAFHLIFRENPFGGGYTIAAGLETAIRYLDRLRFDESDLAYVRSLTGSDGQPLFGDDFIEVLRRFEFGCDVDAIPEGTVVFPQEPLVRVRGPIMQAQIVESALLNVINFQSLIATKAARVVYAAKGDVVLDFGLRRAQGMDGANSASRAAYVGGCHATSNVMAGALHGIPARGTHAHSWVMAFPTELEAFETWAEVMPNNAVLLVDTYNTLDGVRHAIDVAKNLRGQGRELQGIRLDSGDLAVLSIEARRMFDVAGFPKVLITASNELDEHLITSLKDQGARIDVWGVGTRMITAYDQPALGGVYKLTAIRPQGGAWQHKIKLSEEDVKISTPGVLQVRRFESGDVIWDELTGVGAAAPGRPAPEAGAATQGEDLLVPIYRAGKRVYDPPPLDAVRRRREEQLARFDAGIKRFENPDRYPVDLEQGLFDLKARLIAEARGLAA